MKRHMKGFLDKVRRGYKKRGEKFRFIYRVEVGKRGGVHAHILLNRITDADLLVRGGWARGLHPCL